MIGRKYIPCGHQRVRLPEEPGEYPRRCDICKKHYIATITPSTYWTLKLGTPQLVIYWDDEGASRPLEPPVVKPAPTVCVDSLTTDLVPVDVVPADPVPVLPVLPVLPLLSSFATQVPVGSEPPPWLSPTPASPVLPPPVLPPPLKLPVADEPQSKSPNGVAFRPFPVSWAKLMGAEVWVTVIAGSASPTTNAARLLFTLEVLVSCTVTEAVVPLV